MKALRISLFALLATLVAVGVLVGGVWVWVGTSSSLAMALERVSTYLPAGQTLEVADVRGSLREGGHIGSLRWTQGALQVEALDVEVGWSLRPLCDGELRLGRVKMRQLRIDDQRPPTPPADTTPPESLSLPITVDAAFAIDTLVWIGTPSLQATAITGHYKFDSTHHTIDEGQVQISSGSYRATARLQAQSPMALDLRLLGTVQTTLPSSKQRVTVQAQAEVSGALAGQDALLTLKAQLRPELGTGSDKALQATLSADIHPWAAQPLERAQAQWQALNLAALWPQAPQTHMAGDAQVSPKGSGWAGSVQLRNTGSGPWDQQRLPLERLQAQVAFHAGQWVIQSLQADGAAGRIAAQGQVLLADTDTAKMSVWQVKATARAVNPAALDTRLAAVVLDGQLTAQQTPAGIRFDTHLASATNQNATNLPGALRRLKLQTIEVQGVWDQPSLQLDHVLVQTPDARLEGTAAVHTLNLATEAHLNLSLPGATAKLNGHASSTRGDGTLTATVTDAARMGAWLDNLPGPPVNLPASLRQGRGELSARWAGGWQPQQAQAGLTLTVGAQVDNAQHRLALQTVMQGAQLSTSAWQARVDSASLSVQSRNTPGVWNLALTDKVNLSLQRNPRTVVLGLSAGGARLTGPAPGVARLQWQAARWEQASTPDKPANAARWNTQGSLHDLPLGWLELLGQTQMANLGLKGDVFFGGLWDASAGDSLRVRARLERTGGDLQLQAEEAPTGQVQVGLREARLELDVVGDAVSAKLRWDSERAGRAKADLSSRLLRKDGSWTWPADAPLAGTITVQLPPVGAWSVLAPPGWRMRGTLDANATLSGTVAAPHWKGTLQAQDLALRSVVDGIDFSQGTLRASLDGQRLEFEEFKLLGAGGSSGGDLVVKGSVQWLPAIAGATGLASFGERLRMDLVANARAVRISARADRRLVVSGQLTAQLDQARLAIGGKLTADEALFILPEDSTPRLGEDVRVRRAPDTSAQTIPAPNRPSQSVVPSVAITLDLGQKFEVRGRGLNTRLAGSLELRSNADTHQVPLLTGSLRTVLGTYKAYGQQLDVEEGVLRFTGPFDNPALDILAIRPNLPQRVGVQVSGTALAPLVRLYADPDLPDSEKLAWLVLGRSAASGGAESAMLQQAAMALLGGSGPGITARLAQSLGLDELSVASAVSATDGSTAGATVTLGKRVSRDFYIAYESGMAGTMGTLYIFYDLSRRFTLRAQSGQQSAVDLIFTLRYD